MKTLGHAAVKTLLCGLLGAVWGGVPLAHGKPSPAKPQPAADDLPDGDADLPEGDEDGPAPPEPTKPVNKPHTKPVTPPAGDELAPPPGSRAQEAPSKVVEKALGEGEPAAVKGKPAASAEHGRAMVDEEPGDEFLPGGPGPSGRTRELTAHGDAPVTPHRGGAVAKADEGPPLYASPLFYAVAGGVGAGAVVVVVVLLVLAVAVVGSVVFLALNRSVVSNILSSVTSIFAPKTDTGTVKVQVH